jgi:hypothetical protein
VAGSRKFSFPKGLLVEVGKCGSYIGIFLQEVNVLIKANEAVPLIER